MNGTLTLPSPRAGATTEPQPAGGPAEHDPPEPLERLEARICELAGHLTAATYQFLLLVADFDARRGWADWEMASCAAWLSWKCQISPGTAREQVRVARRLEEFPLIRQEFAAARLSYAKVRALTRIVTQETEADLVAMATPMTASQLERFAQAHRRVSEADRDKPRPARKLTWTRFSDDDCQFRAHLPPEDAAVILHALRAARNDLEHPHDGRDHDDHGSRDGGGVSAETRAERLARKDAEAGISFTGEKPPPAEEELTENLADALVQICADYLAARAATADNPDTYQIIIHAGTRAITGVSAETPDAQPQEREAEPELPAGHHARPDRSHLHDGPAITPAALGMIACNATISTMLHNLSGAITDVGRRTRKPPPALRRALAERDRGRCQFPGCDSRRTDAHHIQHWANGGETNLGNLTSLCRRHHRIVHEKDYIIATTMAGFDFYTSDGTLILSCPQLPPSSPGNITTTHRAAITPTTIIPPHSGGRLNLSLAIWIAFANARNKAERKQADG